MTGGLLAAPLAAEAQQTGKVHRIGFLGSTSPKSHGAFVDAFRDGLRARGYVEGKHVFIEYRWAESDYNRLPALAADLVSLNVDLILTHGTPGGRAAKAATTTIPIVIAISGDVDATGLVQSLAHPGGNLTGLSFSFPELNSKGIEMIKEALPSLKRVAVLMNDTNPGNVVTFEAMRRTARTVGVDIVQIFARSPGDFDGAFGQITRSRAEAVRCMRIRCSSRIRCGWRPWRSDIGCQASASKPPCPARYHVEPWRSGASSLLRLDAGLLVGVGGAVRGEAASEARPH